MGCSQPSEWHPNQWSNNNLDLLAVLSAKRYDRKCNCVLIPNDINLDTMPTTFRQGTMNPNQKDWEVNFFPSHTREFYTSV